MTILPIGRAAGVLDVIANAIMTVPQDRADNKKYEVDE